jgi:MFS family permease
MKMPHPIYNLQFGLVCLSSLLLPELPDYLSSLGGAEHKGLIVALFTLTAGLSRPFSGRLTDTLGRVPIMAVGSIVCFVCGFLYPILGTVSGFLFLRLLHGFSTGFKPTATSAYVADIVPRGRWGEALGFHGLCFNTGLAIGPALGSTITLYYSLDAMFYTSSLFALLSIAILMNMKETLKDKKPFHWSALKITRHDIFDFGVFPAALVTFMAYIGYGVVLTLVPDLSGHIGLKNKGLFFLVLTLSSLVMRFISGRTSDRYGRVQVVNVGLVLLVLALFSTGFAKTFPALMAAAGLYGIATGLLSPALNAWTIDMAHPEFRGKAIATMYIALEAGIGIGALLSGWFYQDIASHIPAVFYSAAVVAMLALIYMRFRSKDRDGLVIEV